MLTLTPGPVEVGGVHLANHLVLAAGVLGTSGASLARQLRNGAGGVVTKSIGPVPMPGHAGPCLVPLEDGLLNAMGLPNPSREFVGELGAVSGAPVVASIFGGSPAEFAEVGSWFAGRVAGLELNLSCPHAEGYGAALGSDPALVEECTRAVADLGLPVWVKLTPNVTDIAGIGQRRRAGRSLGPGRNQHGPGHADLDRAPPARPRQPLRRALGEGRLPGRGPVRVRALRGRQHPGHRLRRRCVRKRRPRD